MPMRVAQISIAYLPYKPARYNRTRMASGMMIVSKNQMRVEARCFMVCSSTFFDADQKVPIDVGGAMNPFVALPAHQDHVVGIEP